MGVNWSISFSGLPLTEDSVDLQTHTSVTDTPTVVDSCDFSNYENSLEYLEKWHDMHIKTGEIVAFVGRAGAGKNYQCEICKENGFTEVAFADALRDIAFSALNLVPEGEMEKDYYTKHYEEYKASDCIRVFDHDGDKHDMNFRKFLELLGTQGIRKYDNDFWVRALLKTIKDKDLKRVCISDMRFMNEYDGLKKFAEENGYALKVIFCDYHSNRYQTNNTHQSAVMGNFFAENGYTDLQELTDADFEKYRKEVGI